MDSKGNIIMGTAAILILSLLLIAIFVVTSVNFIENENIDSQANDNFKYIIDDYNENLEVLGRESIAEITDNVYNSFRVFNSPKEIKKTLDKKLDVKNEDYKEKYNVDMSSEVLSVENTDDPCKILFKVKLKVLKENEMYNGIVERNSSIEGLKDPLPYAKFSAYSGILNDGKTIYYNHVLFAYLKLHLMKCPESYLFATAPAIIQKCPYDPYIHHGDSDVLKDCLNNGYFHESADGSCYLCRLEGKGKCPHYGFEVFIQPHTILPNDSVSCSDHVVLNDHYPGKKIDLTDINSLILDDSHRKKYGLI